MRVVWGARERPKRAARQRTNNGWTSKQARTKIPQRETPISHQAQFTSSSWHGKIHENHISAVGSPRTRHCERHLQQRHPQQVFFAAVITSSSKDNQTQEPQHLSLSSVLEIFSGTGGLYPMPRWFIWKGQTLVASARALER